MKDAINNLNSEIKDIGKADLTKDGWYRASLVSAFVKAYEYLVYVNNDENLDNMYFSLGSLRGICEDYIFLRFIGQLNRDNRDKAIDSITHLKFLQTLERQTNFFKSTRSFQPVIENTNDIDQQRQDAKNTLKEIGRESGLWRPNIAIPKVHWMAQSLEIKAFYDFYYCISSENVHFNPRVLLRMGWYNKEESANFTTDNFKQYYKEFGIVYGALLFCEFTNELQDHLILSPNFINDVKIIEDSLNDILRWPEPITYEEMNLEGPSTIVRAVMKTAGKEANKAPGCVKTPPKR